MNACALSDRRGKLPFRLAKGGNLGMSRGVDESTDVPADVIKVPCTRLDDCFDHRDRTLVVKLDLEGHEIKALRGMEKLIERNRIVLQTEIHPQYLKVMNNYLEKLGFKHLRKISSNHLYRNFAMEN